LSDTEREMPAEYEPTADQRALRVKTLVELMKSRDDRVRLDAAKYYTARRMGWKKQPLSATTSIVSTSRIWRAGSSIDCGFGFIRKWAATDVRGIDRDKHSHSCRQATTYAAGGGE
jgi:hypothetical protein